MESRKYQGTIYNLKRRLKQIKSSLCDGKREELRNVLLSMEQEIDSLIDDYNA